MSLERRFVNFVPFAIATLLIAGMVALVVNFYQINSADSTIEVKTLGAVQVAPKVNYIPTKSRANQKVDISNSILPPRALKPVVITI